MSQFDLQPLDAPAEPSAPAAGFDLQPVETSPTEGDNLGVTQMPSRAEHMRVLAEIQAEPVSLTAYKASRGPTPEKAAQALQLAKERGVSPDWAAQNVDALQQQSDLAGLKDMLGSSPIVREYAAQSGVHASLVKDDVGVLEALAQGLEDIGYQEIATAQMSFPTQAGEQILRNYEDNAAALDQRPTGFVAEAARSVPSLGVYYLSSKLGGLLGGKPGEIASSGGMMFLLNRGALYRRIQQNAPNADQLALRYTEENPGRDVSDEQYAKFVQQATDFDQRARVYATVGASASAALGAGLSSAISLAVPGAARKVQSISTEIVARAFSDEATRAAVEKLAAIGGHTLAGALFMAVPAVVDDATVQKAVTGQVDLGRAMEAGWDAFKKSLLAAGVLSTAPHVVRRVAEELGRARQAPAEVERLDHLVDQAQASKLRERAPAEFEQITGKMAAQGDAPTVYVNAEAAQRPEVAQRLVEALADDGQALAEAQATGADVAVPTEKYLSVLADQHDALREDVKLSPDGATIKEAQDILNGPVSKLLAERTMIDQQPDSPEKTTALQALHERMRDAIAAQYRSDPNEYAQAFTDSVQKQLAAAVAPQAKPAAVPSATDAAAWARRLAEDKTISELQPGRYELAARRAEDKLAEIATQAAEKGQEAVRQGFLGAGAQAAGSEQTQAAGVANLRQAGTKADAAAKKLAQVPQLELARDLARAQAKVHADLVDEMQRARDYIAKRDTDKGRADLAKASPEYLDTFSTILDAIDDNTPRATPRPLAVDSLLLRMASDAEPVGFDPDRLRDILSDSKGWKGLTPPEARTVLDAVKNIRTAARRQNELTLMDRKETLRDFVAGVRAHLDELHVPDSGLPSPSRASEGFGAGAAKTATALHTELLQPREILRRLGAGGETIYDAFVGARNGKEELSRQVGEHLYKAYELDLPKELKRTRFDGVKGPESPVVADNLWTRQDLWEFASWWGSESGAERIKRGLRITDGRAHEFMSQLTNAEADFLEAKWKLNDDKLWPLIRDHTSEVTGSSPTKIEAQPFTIRTAEGEVRELHGGYEPARYRSDTESTASAPENAQTIADYWGTLRDDFPSTANYFLKERVKNVSRVPDLNWSSYSSHVNSVLHYLAYDNFVRDTGRVFRDAEFRELVQHRLGPQAMIELDKFLGVAARGRVEVPQDGARRWSAIVGSAFRSRVATAAFQLNPRILAGQFSHIPAAMAALKLTPADMLFGWSQAMNPTTWGKSFDESRQLPYRWNGFGAKMREQLANIGPGETGTTGKWVDAAGWSAYHAVDGFLSKWIYEAAASKAERARASPAEARGAGDNAVATMMAPLNLAEQSSFARDRGVIGALLLVRNFPNTLYNVGAMLEWDARNEVRSADPGWQKAKVALGAYGAAGASYLGMVWAAHILGRFLMGHGRQPDEKTSEWLEREAIAAPLYPVPFVSDVAAPVAQAIVTHKTLKQSFREHGIASAPAIAALEHSIRDLGDAFDSHGRTQDRVFAGLRLGAFALGLPSEPLRGVQYGLNLAQGRVHPRGPFDVASGLTYGKRKNQAKNPFSVSQDLLSGR